MLPLTLFRKGYGVRVISFADIGQKTESVFDTRDFGFDVEQYSAFGFKEHADMVRKHIIRYRPDIVYGVKISL
ncbi:MAG: hypothetical protein B1H11_12510 [Desulfobacteraceae bacterium 4484_190.1]|nr:MAG: hypothetical protein B1H11_12510 [Desulfobacteraceae bacterium 4484_190.1]